MKDSFEPILTAPEDLEMSEIYYIEKTISCINNTSPNAIVFPSVWGLPNEREQKVLTPMNILIVGGKLYPPIEEAVYSKLMDCKTYRKSILPDDLYAEEINCNQYPEMKSGKPIWEDKSFWYHFRGYYFPCAVLKIPDIILIHSGAPRIRELLWQMDGRRKADRIQCDSVPRLYMLTEDGYKSFVFIELKDGTMILNVYDDEINSFYGSYVVSENEELRRIPDWHPDSLRINEVKGSYFDKK